MNKKRFAILGFAAILVSTTSVACGSTEQTTETTVTTVATESAVSNEPDYEELFAYTQYTPEEKIVEGNETAVNTISKFLDCEVNVGEDYQIPLTMLAYPASGENENDIYRVYKACDYDSNKYSILFLFQDDTKIVEATDVSNSYIDDTYTISKDYMNEANSLNYSDGAFASYADGKSTVFLSSESGYNLSSIWGYDSEDQKVSLIWINNDCPIWKNHI